METAIDAILPPAKKFAEKLVAHQKDELLKQTRRDGQLAEERKAQLDQLKQPSGISEEEAVRRAIKLIERAVSNGLTEIQIYRFPNALCTDHGRAINQQEPGWEETLTGVPKEIYQLWEKYFRSRGYKLKAQIIDYPNGMPGDVGIALKWT